MSSGNSSPAFGRRVAPTDIPVVVYGTRWCAATQRVRRYLERMGVAHDFVDLETSPEAVARLKWLTGGTASHPTVYIGGSVLVEPSPAELEWALARSGLQ